MAFRYPVATSYFVRIDSVDFFTPAIARFRQDNYALPGLSTLLGLFRSCILLLLEILALRRQLAMVNQTPRKRLSSHWHERLSWVWLYLCFRETYITHD